MTRFSLLHPSRGRLQLAEAAIDEWQRQASGRYPLEYILSVDDDDDVDGYRQLAARRGVRLVVNRNRSIVDAVNQAARVASGDIFIVVSDDFGCPQRWDERLIEVMGERRDVAVLVHDEGDGRIMTLPILGRDLYRQLGYVYYPDYFSMFCDDDLTRAAEARGKLLDGRQLVFPHRHCWRPDGNPFDATYARENSDAAWWSGWRVFEKRRAAHFGLRPWSPGLAATALWVDARYFTWVWGGRVKRRLFGLAPRR